MLRRRGDGRGKVDREFVACTCGRARGPCRSDLLSARWSAILHQQRRQRSRRFHSGRSSFDLLTEAVHPSPVRLLRWPRP